MKSSFAIIIASIWVLISCKNNSVTSIISSDDLDVRVTIEVVSGYDAPVLTKGTVGTEDNNHGFEGGTVIKLQDGYHLFTGEIAGEIMWTKSKLGHWLSKDGKDWRRISTIFNSTGDYTGSDPRATLWSPMPVFNERDNRWNFFYVGYRSKPDSGGIWLAEFDAHVFRAISRTRGIDGIDGPYEDVNLILNRDKESEAWEGSYGTDSFFPYLASDGKYYGFYGSAETRRQPMNLWQVGLASSKKLEGPWKRCTEINPLDNGLSFIENPVVTKLENGLYVAVVDAGYDSLQLCRSAFGYIWSKDGIHWSKERLCYLEPKVPKWWRMMRTPLCLIKENDSIYTVFHTAFVTLHVKERKYTTGFDVAQDWGSVGMLKVKLIIDTIRPLKYTDNRPVSKYRMDATDIGVVLPFGDGPDSCDIMGAREAIVNKEDDTYYLFYDGAGPKGWLACLATSKDMVHWEKRGKILNFGKKGEPDQATATSPWVYKERKQWHMFYLGSPNATPPPDNIPSFPYLTLKAVSNSLAGPWIKQKNNTPFATKPETYYSATASPGFIVKQKNEYIQFFSASTIDTVTRKIQRTLGIARTNNINGKWKIDDTPLVPLDEQIENSSLYYETSNQTWFLFTNHIGYDSQGEYTDAIWVY
jgi:hypothetical protein